MPGLIDTFCKTVGEAIESPAQFVFWSGVALTSSLMGKQVFTTIRANSERDRLYGNVFVLLVGPPGVGKTDAITEARLQARNAKAPLGPDDVSGERLIHYAKTGKDDQISKGTFSVFLDEFNQLFHDANSTALKRVLVSFYDCRVDVYHRETHAHQKETVEDMCLTLIGGATPAHMASCFAPREWQEGLPSRIIYVWGGEQIIRESWHRGDMDSLAREVKKVQNHIFNMRGVKWSPESEEARKHWRREAMNDEPVHPLLAGYNTRRLVTTSKLALVLCISRCGKRIEIADWNAAHEALTSVEKNIHRALALAGGNEYRDVEEWMETLFIKQKLVPEWQMRRYLGQRINPHLVEMVLTELIAQRRILVTNGAERPGRMFAKPVDEGAPPAKRQKAKANLKLVEKED